MKSLFRSLILIPTLALISLNAKEDDRPNILLILSDDHNYRALGCSGNKAIRTPHLDRLAAEGVYFNRCFTPNPICTPSRACIFTGQDSWTNGVIFNGKAIREDSPVMPVLLANAGYETAFIGKWHNDGKPWTRGYTTGGRCWAGGKFDHFEMDVTPFGGEPKDRVTADRYSTTLFTDDAVEYLKKTHAAPFCLVLAYTVAHDDFLAPPGYEGKYSPEAILLPPNFMAKPPFKQFNPTIRDERELPFPRVEKDIRAATAEYYAMIEHMDENIGRMLSTLEEKEIDKETVVIFCSVKGLSMGSHGIIGKQTMYEEGLRTSLIVRHPGLKAAAGGNSELVSTTDILPTVCEAAGISIPEAVEGKSLLDHYQGKGEGRERLFFSYHDPTRSTVTRAVRTKRHKLVQHLVTGERQLFDLAEDPIEMDNLTGKPEVKTIEDALTKDLERWREGAEGR
ncbi:MAG: sulfatase-like hydrolase/transferase [Verrucomicrobiales bacterium]|nr:sulfatase-like hydrolase/transferase [Verrucomicrobiales bacterium]